MERSLPALAVALLALLAVLAACSGDDSGAGGGGSDGADGQPLRVASMAAAVEALEAQLGGPQRYYEVNATPTLVNLFVAEADGSAVAYVYDAVAGTLGTPTEPRQASGDTFTWSQADFDPDRVLGDALEQLPAALPRTFAVTANGPDAVQYVVTLESSQGGVLDVLVDGAGAVLGAGARDE